MADAPFNHFNSTAYDLGRGVFDLAAHTIMAMLTNVAPDPNAHYYSDLRSTELAPGNGYVAGGLIVPSTGLVNSADVASFNVGAVIWTSAVGAMGPFRYVVYYDLTAPNKNLLGWFDNGASLTLNGLNSDVFDFAIDGAVLFTLAISP